MYFVIDLFKRSKFYLKNIIILQKYVLCFNQNKKKKYKKRLNISIVTVFGTYRPVFLYFIVIFLVTFSVIIESRSVYVLILKFSCCLVLEFSLICLCT